jgi:hypothetical protein
MRIMKDTLCNHICRLVFILQHVFPDVLLPCHSLLMKTIVTEMGLFEGLPNNRILTHNLELLRQGQYHFAGQLVAWSVANGGPGLACLSKQMIRLLCGHSIDDLSAAAEHIPDDGIRTTILEVLSNAFILAEKNIAVVI